MITFPCDKCERALEVDDNLAGAKVECPYCGDVNSVPKAAAGAGGRPIAKPAGPRAAGESGGKVSAVASDRATAMGLPPDSGPEQHVITIHPALFRARPWLSLLLLVLLVGGIVGVGIGLTTGMFPVVIAASVVCAVGLGWLGVWKIMSLTAALIITNKRTTERRGLLSRSTCEVLHDRVQDIQITQSVTQRMLKVGRIGVSSSGEADVEIVMDDIPDPIRVREIIDAYRNIA